MRTHRRLLVLSIACLAVLSGPLAGGVHRGPVATSGILVPARVLDALFPGAASTGPRLVAGAPDTRTGSSAYPSTGFVPPRVNDTLVLANDTLVSGNFLAANGVDPTSAAYDSGTRQIFVGNSGSAVVSVLSAVTQKVVASVAVQTDVGAIVYDSAKGEVFATDLDSHNVSVIADTNDSVVATVHVGTRPEALAYDSTAGQVWVAAAGSNNVSVIADTNNSVVKSVQLTYTPVGLAFDSALNRVFVAEESEAPIVYLCYITSSYAVSTAHPMAADFGGIAYDPVANQLFLTEPTTDNVSQLNATSLDPVSPGSDDLPVGDGPTGVSYDSWNEQVYVANGASDTVSEILVNSSTVLGGIPVGEDPTGIAAAGATGNVYVTNSESDNVSVVSVNDSATVATTRLGATPQGVALDSGKREVFATLAATDSVDVISDATKKVVTTVVVGTDPYAAAYDPSLGEVFVANLGSDNVSVINDTEDRVVGSVGVGLAPQALAYDAADGHLFVADGGSESVSVVSTASNTVLTSVTLPSEPSAVAYDRGAGEVFVTLGAASTLGAIDPGSNVLVANVTVVGAQSAAYDSGTGEIFVGTGGGNVTVVNDTADRIAAVAEVGADPLSLAYDPGEGAVFAVNTGSDNVSLISDFNNSVLASVPVGASPTSAVFDASAGFVFVANSAQGTISILSPGTVPAPLLSAAISPPSDTVSLRGSSNFTAIPTCRGAACPAGTVYSWNLTRPALGALNSTSGTSVEFTAGDSAGSEGLYVNATLNGRTLQGVPASIGISSAPVPTLSSVAIAPTSGSLEVGAQGTFSASPACAGGSCPAGATYAWTLSNARGTLNASSGPSVTVTAGSAAGAVQLWVNATLNARTVSSSVPVVITGAPGSSAGAPKLLGLPLLEAYGLVGALAAAATAGTAIALARRGRTPPAA